MTIRSKITVHQTHQTLIRESVVLSSGLYVHILCTSTFTSYGECCIGDYKKQKLPMGSDCSTGRPFAEPRWCGCCFPSSLPCKIWYRNIIKYMSFDVITQEEHLRNNCAWLKGAIFQEPVMSITGHISTVPIFCHSALLPIDYNSSFSSIFFLSQLQTVVVSSSWETCSILSRISGRLIWRSAYIWNTL